MINLPDDLHEELRQDAQDLSVPMNAYITMLIKQAKDYNDTIKKMKSEEFLTLVEFGREITKRDKGKK